MTPNDKMSASEKKGPTGQRYQDTGTKNREFGRFLEIMLYAVGLVLVMIAVWYHNPHNFF